MVQYRRHLAVLAFAALALVLAGCNGGGGELAHDPGTVGTATVSGTVYAPSPTGSASTLTAQTPGDRPVPNCPVEVVTEPEGEQLASGRTNADGGYRFGHLPENALVVVEAHVPNFGELMRRVQLRAGQSHADVDQDTTLAAVCAREAAARGNGPANQEFANEVAEECLQFRRQHGPPADRPGAGPPDFANSGEVARAARNLLGLTAGAALQDAVDLRTEGPARKAVRLMIAYLRARHGSDLQWGDELVERLVEAVLAGETVTVEQAADALGEHVTPAMVQDALDALREKLGLDAPERAPELYEVTAALSIATGDAALATDAQVQAFVEALTSASGTE